MHYWSNFLTNHARKNLNSFSDDKLVPFLMYNYLPTYTSMLDTPITYHFEQTYYFTPDHETLPQCLRKCDASLQKAEQDGNFVQEAKDEYIVCIRVCQNTHTD